MAVIYFINDEWPTQTKAGVGIDLESKRCINASASVNFLKNQSLKDIIAWGLQRAKVMTIVWNPRGLLNVGKEEK